MIIGIFLLRTIDVDILYVLIPPKANLPIRNLTGNKPGGHTLLKLVKGKYT